MLCVISILAMTACGAQEEEQEREQYVEGTLAGVELGTSFDSTDTFALNGDDELGYNPYVTVNVDNRVVAQLVYENIYELDDDFNLTSRIITAADTQDGMYWYFTIADDIIMHDGEPLMAEDVSYSIQRAMNSTRYGQRMSKFWGAGSTGDYTFAVTLSEPNMQLPYLLTIPIIQNGSIGEHKPVGTGPYMFDTEEGGDLIASPYYPYDLPIDKVGTESYDSVEDKLSGYRNGEIDLVVNDASGGANLGYGGGSEIRYYMTTNMHFIGFNLTEDKATSFQMNASYRYALQLALDRDYAANEVMNGAASPAALPIAPNHVLYNEDIAAEIGFDLERCESILRNSGVQDYDNDGKLEYMVTGIPMEIELDMIVSSDSGGKGDIARQFVEALDSIGITVTLRELSWDEYILALAEGEYDIYYGEVMLTPDFDLSKLLREGGSLNYGEIDDPGYETLILAYLASDEELLEQNASMMFDYIADTAPIIPVLFERREVITHRNVLSGLMPSQSNVFYGIENWKFNVG